MTDFPERFSLLQEVYLGDGHDRYEVESARTKSRVFLTLTGIGSREEAQKLGGRGVWIPRDQAMPLPAGQLYADQIIGLAVETEDGQHLGTVVDLIVTGANDVYVVQSAGKELLVPAIRDVVKVIDVDAGRIVIEPMDGLFGAP